MASSSRAFTTSARALQTGRDYLAAATTAAPARSAFGGAAALSYPMEHIAPVEEPGRKRFPIPDRDSRSNMISPSDLTQRALWARRTPPRPPLLGPKSHEAKQIDPFHITRTSPLELTYHTGVSQVFCNPLGRIRGRAETALTWKSQRMMGKLIRRQRAMGLISNWTNENTQKDFAHGTASMGAWGR